MTHRPAGTFHPPTTDQYTADLDRRTRQLEQRRQPNPYVPRFCLTATNPAPINEGRTTARWWPWRGAVDLEYVTVDVQDAGVGTVTIRRAGTALIEVDLIDGVTRLGVDHRWTPADFLDLTITGTVGLILVQMWFRGEGGGALVFSIPDGGEA